jgi:hypothetical protein
VAQRLAVLLSAPLKNGTLEGLASKGMTSRNWDSNSR